MISVHGLDLSPPFLPKKILGHFFPQNASKRLFPKKSFQSALSFYVVVTSSKKLEMFHALLFHS